MLRLHSEVCQSIIKEGGEQQSQIFDQLVCDESGQIRDVAVHVICNMAYRLGRPKDDQTTTRILGIQT
jgi:hypothetical protein